MPLVVGAPTFPVAINVAFGMMVLQPPAAADRATIVLVWTARTRAVVPPPTNATVAAGAVRVQLKDVSGPVAAMWRATILLGCIT